MAEKKFGRKKRLTPEELLQAIHDTACTELTTLAKHTGVERTTVWRRMKELSQDQIDAVLKEVAETDLKPMETQYEVFMKLPVMADMASKLDGKVSPKHARDTLRTVYRVCILLNKKPDKITVDEVAELVEKARKGEVNISPKTVRAKMRVWFQKRGISRQLLTAKGIESIPLTKDKKRARTRLTEKQRAAFMEVLQDFCSSMPEADKLEWLTLPKYLYYTGTRIAAALLGLIEDLEKGPVIWRHNILDKGKHKTGRQPWRKKITGELKDLVARILELRQTEEGFLFNIYNHGQKIGTRVQKVRDVFKMCYEKAGIPKSTYATMPCHIWRHTACQDMLEATNYNFDVTAAILGWESVDTMKKHYGAIGENILDKALAEAMGLPVTWEKKVFKF